MNLLRICYEYPEPWDSIGIVAYELSKAQAKLYESVTIFCAGVRTNKLAQNNVQIIKFPRQLHKFSVFLTTAPAVLLGYFKYRLSGKRFSVIHGHGHLPIYLHIFKYVFPWVDKTPYFLHLHITAKGREVEMTAKNLPISFWAKNFEWPLHKLSDYLGVRVASKVFCVSESVRNEAIKYYSADPSKVVFLGSGVNTDLFKPASNPEKSEKVILYSGTLVRRKNPDLLIIALKFLPSNYRVIFCGKGDDTELLKLANQEGVGDRVTFTSNIPYLEMPKFYQQADIFVLPSSYEGYPKVVLEAMACGLPAIVSGFDISSEIQKHAHYAKHTPEELAGQIKLILENNEVVDDTTIANIKNRFSWDALANLIDNEYQKVLVR